MPILPPEFNFPGAQQGVPQSIFSLIQAMSGFGPQGMGGMQGSPLGANFAQTLGQLMQPTARPVTGSPTQTLPILPPMPTVQKAPVVAPRPQTAPVTAKAAVTKPLDPNRLVASPDGTLKRASAMRTIKGTPAEQQAQLAKIQRQDRYRR